MIAWIALSIGFVAGAMWASRPRVTRLGPIVNGCQIHDNHMETRDGYWRIKFEEECG